MGKGGKTPELAIKVALDPVVDKDKFQGKINEIYSEKKPLPVYAEIKAKEMFDTVTAYQANGEHKVPILGKITNTPEMFADLEGYNVSLNKVELGSDSLAGIHTQLKNEEFELDTVKLSDTSIDAIVGQLQNAINGLDLSKLTVKQTVDNSKAQVPSTVKQTVQQTVVQHVVRDKAPTVVKTPTKQEKPLVSDSKYYKLVKQRDNIEKPYRDAISSAEKLDNITQDTLSRIEKMSQGDDGFWKQTAGGLNDLVEKLKGSSSGIIQVSENLESFFSNLEKTSNHFNADAISFDSEKLEANVKDINKLVLAVEAKSKAENIDLDIMHESDAIGDKILNRMPEEIKSYKDLTKVAKAYLQVCTLFSANTSDDNMNNIGYRLMDLMSPNKYWFNIPEGYQEELYKISKNGYSQENVIDLIKMLGNMHGIKVPDISPTVSIDQPQVQQQVQEQVATAVEQANAVAEKEPVPVPVGVKPEDTGKLRENIQNGLNPIGLTFEPAEGALGELKIKVETDFGAVNISEFSPSPDALTKLNEDISKGIGKISVDVTSAKKQQEVEQLSFLPQDPVEQKAKKPVAKKTVTTPSDDKILEMMANAQNKAIDQEKAEADVAKQKAIIYQNMVDHQAKAAEIANDATSNTAKGLSDANKSMNDLNADAEKFGQNWKQIVTLISGATKNLADLMVGSQYKGSYDKKNKEWKGGRYRSIFGGFEEFQEVEDMDSESPDKYLDPIRKWATSLSKAATEDFDSQRMLEAIHMMSGLAEALKNVNLDELPTLYKDGNKMRDVSVKKDELISQVAQLKSIFPVSDSNDAFWGEKEDSIRYLLDLLGQAAKYYTAVGSAAKQTAENLATANVGFANQTKQLEQTNVELEKAKQNTTEAVSKEISTTVIPTAETTGKAEIKSDDIIKPEYVDFKGRATIAIEDIKVPDKIDLNGNLVIKNATKEIKAAAAEAEKEVSKESGKDSKKDADKEKQRKKKEYLLALGSLLKKNANAQNELSDMYPDAPDYKEMQSWIGKLQRRTGTTVNLLDNLVGRDGWQNDVLFTSAVEEFNHIRGKKKAGDKTSEILKNGINEEKEYVSLLKQIPGLEDAATKALADFGDQSAHYQDANKKLTNAKDTIDVFEQKYGETYSNLLRSEIIEQQNLSKAMAQEKLTREAQLAQEEEANKKRIADEQKYLSLLAQETKDHQTALEVQREYGDKDFRTQYAMEDWQKSNKDLKALEATVKKQSGNLSNVPGYDEVVEKNRRSWMQWGQNQQDISAKQRAADLKDNTSLLNNYNKALEAQAKLLQGLYKIDQSKDPGGYAAKQIALQSNAINVANLRKDIKSCGLENESAYTDANTKYLAGINAANLTKEQKANDTAQKEQAKTQAGIVKQQDEWLKKTTDNINTVKKEYISAFKEIQDLQQKLLQTNDQALQTNLNQQIQDQRTIMKDSGNRLNGYLHTPLVGELAQNAFDEIHAVKASYAQDTSLQNEQSSIDNIVQSCKELNALYKTRQSMFKPEDAKNLADLDQKIQNLEKHVQDLVVTSEQAGIFVTNSADVADALNKSGEKKLQTETAFDASKQNYDINAAKNSYIQNFKKKRENEDLLNRVDQNDPDRIQKLQRYTQWIQENETAIQNAKQILNSYHAAANEAWKEIQQLVDSTSTKDIEAKNAEAEAAKKKAESDAKKAAADARKQASEDSSYFSQLNQAVNNKLRTYKAFLEADRKDPTKKSKEYFAARGNFNDADSNFAELVQNGVNSGYNADARFDSITDRHNRNIDAIAEANTKRAQAEADAIKVAEKDIDTIQTLSNDFDQMQNQLRNANGTNTNTYSAAISNQALSNDLVNRLRNSAGTGNDNKNVVAVDWANSNQIQGIKDYEDAVRYLNQQLEIYRNETRSISSDSSFNKSITKNRTELANLQSQLHDYLGKFPSVSNRLATQVQALQKALADPTAYQNVSKLKQQFAELRAEAKSVGLETESLIDKFKNLFGQHLSTMITMAALHKMQDALRVVYQNVVEIDTALTELKKVSELSGQALTDYMDRTADSAQKLGVSISDYISSTADWKRLGYSDEDAENMATYSTLLKNVGDDIDDVNTSSSYLISTLQGFGLLAKDAEDVVNQIDSVANTQPITADAIGQILQRSASAMASSNNTLSETISLGTAAYSVLQNAESTGTMLKSLSMYLRAAKSELEDAGESADGCANSVSELRSELKALTGVDIMVDNKNFKSTYQIMKELSEVWGSLSDVTKANVTEMIAGKRNANGALAILDNFSTAESAMESAANSAGVAWKENETYLSSIQAKLNQLESSFQALSQDLLDDDLIKSVVSLATAFTKGADAVVKFTGAFPQVAFFGTLATQLGEPKMTGFMIVPSNTPGGDTEQMLRKHSIYTTVCAA